MPKTTLRITSKNYSSWSMRGWLLTKFSGLPFQEEIVSPDDPQARAEILLLSSSILVPSLKHGKTLVWDTLAIAEYLNEIRPEAKLLPANQAARAHCRAICGEMHSGTFPVSRYGRVRKPISTASPRSGKNVWPLMAALSCSANAAWPMPCTRP